VFINGRVLGSIALRASALLTFTHYLHFARAEEGLIGKIYVYVMADPLVAQSAQHFARA
jgi:hypothetical protein